MLQELKVLQMDLLELVAVELVKQDQLIQVDHKQELVVMVDRLWLDAHVLTPPDALTSTVHRIQAGGYKTIIRIS